MSTTTPTDRPAAAGVPLGTTDDPASPESRLLTAALVVAPLVYLAADSTYAARGWDDGTAGVLHVLGAVGYGFVVLRVARALPAGSRLRAALVLVGLLGMAGNVAYGFEAIHMSWGDVQLVDRTGAASLIKPLGLCFPASLALAAVALARVGARWQAAVVLVATLGWPVAHIGNLPAVAVPVNIALVVALGSLARAGARGRAESD
ncbi:hypothetical protein [Phycicoccus sonneratiae]|uniref:Uncharacterized protein n=1 Tax=Phycicoccus sonneratiae TaxID=2807628 RepID=A0ABS2CKV9_9MICO|nr:hypothetical protein [Phycicoccus sonneraticus]MBM6400520.1 hypothetical protein [Phycicoccus sonneraticus]